MTINSKNNDNKKLVKQYAALSSNKLPEYENKKWLKIWIINFMETLEKNTGKGPEIWFTGKSLRVVKCLLENMYDLPIEHLCFVYPFFTLPSHS